MVQKVPLGEAIKSKILLFDGAMGTEIQKLNPKPEDFPDGKDGFNDGLSFTRPDWIRNIHRSYLKAGADCIETNTFGSNKAGLVGGSFRLRRLACSDNLASGGTPSR